METKVCIKCNVEQSMEVFRPHGMTGKRTNVCNECRYAYWRWYNKAKREGTLPEKDPTQKLCPICKETKPIEEYSKRSGKRAGQPRSWCKQCNANKMKEYRETNHSEVIRRQREYYQRDKALGKTTIDARKWSITKWERQLNLEKGWLHAYIESHHGKCEICGKQPKTLHVDHCHATNTFRGLLCASCNTSLGKFNDDTDILRKAITYLETHRRDNLN